MLGGGGVDLGLTPPQDQGTPTSSLFKRNFSLSISGYLVELERQRCEEGFLQDKVTTTDVSTTTTITTATATAATATGETTGGGDSTKQTTK
jgi:hypothetical protein